MRLLVLVVCGRVSDHVLSVHTAVVALLTFERLVALVVEHVLLQHSTQHFQKALRQWSWVSRAKKLFGGLI